MCSTRQPAWGWKQRCGSVGIVYVSAEFATPGLVRQAVRDVYRCKLCSTAHLVLVWFTVLLICTSETSGPAQHEGAHTYSCAE
jgi:RNA polymerase subunit RPABC4/transcription elongation factor Spt4